ncbi:hypothetical protein RRG08_026666 [Elysia crispata]|uniref:Uncharacterized protein n=1 Tax=Elysia crispata TaxID=231223 RepID=A0AAE1E6U5_9GAST|nr:hypothetical protein RRG08_026666 [Elysia crispata]
MRSVFLNSLQDEITLPPQAAEQPGVCLLWLGVRPEQPGNCLLWLGVRPEQPGVCLLWLGVRPEQPGNCLLWLSETRSAWCLSAVAWT